VSAGIVSVRFVARRSDGTTQVHDVQAAAG